ncbi:hypothetical protein SUGI_1130450 [Cryptomeria japonica]|nr:hypothetical protein SUGI_1130450 [Cryptomeria japonica]
MASYCSRIAVGLFVTAAVLINGVAARPFRVDETVRWVPRLGSFNDWVQKYRFLIGYTLGNHSPSPAPEPARGPVKGRFSPEKAGCCQGNCCELENLLVCCERHL